MFAGRSRSSFVSVALLVASGCTSDPSATPTVGDTTTAGSGEETTGDVTGEPTTTTDPMTPTTGEPGEPAVCGDGVVQPGEQCDDGNDSPDDGCTDDCTLPACGDGIIQAGEQCDSGAMNGEHAACLPDCVVNVCGDGFVGPGEACDDGDDDDGDACGNDCAPSSCGDGLVEAEAGEQCDDGNGDDGDACLSTCVLAGCGDGVVQTKDEGGQPLPPGQAEACDDGALNADNAGCTSACKLAQCGDGLVHSGVEACDNGADNGPTGACLSDCSANVCGDGFVGPTEACDDGNTEAGDGCGPTCALESCGDGVVQPGEQCDDGMNGDDDDDCTDQCKLEACGDGIVQSGEECDDGDLNAKTAACTLACKQAVCGDGWVWGNHEACDDGPANGDDAACTSACDIAVCGDGLVGPGETCDDGGNDPGDGCGATCISEVCGNGLVDPGEVCDDGNDVDDDACTNACTLPEPCDGPHVSLDTCVPSKQCGTIARPWCSISAALAGSASSPIKVARSGNAYGDHVVMKDGVDVLGGYEPTFVAPRDPNPETNFTTVRGFGPVFEWNFEVTATLDGFTVLVDPHVQLPSTQSSVRIDGSAHATLNGVRVGPFDASKSFGSNTYGILVTSGSGGSVVVGPMSEVTGTRAGKSVALGVTLNAELASILVNGELRGGTGSHSFAVEHLGLGDLTLDGGRAYAGTGTNTSTGILVGRDGYGTTQLIDAAVHGGASKLATGVDHRKGQALRITGGAILGGGIADNTAVIAGVLTEAVDTIVVKDADVRGCNVAVGTTPETSRALDLRNTAAAAITGATIEGATIDGGKLADSLTGVRVLGVPLTVTGSTITATGGVFGRFDRGIHVTGTFAPGAAVSIHDNQSIDGGTIVNASQGLFTIGVDVDAVVPIAIENNAKISGAGTPSKAMAAGVRLMAAGAGHEITGNALVTGGPDDAGFYEHVGVYIYESGVLIADNQKIAGNDDLQHRGTEPWGIFARDSQIVVRDNALIIGGHAVGGSSGAAYGVYVWGPAGGGTAVIEDNTIVAGTTSRAAYGLVIEERTPATVRRNVVFVCPFHGEDPLCKTGVPSAALISAGNLGSLYANNWFFGGHTSLARGCMFGCPEGSYGCAKNPGQFRFDSNLCHVENGGSAVYVEPNNNYDKPPSLFVNNIFHVESGTSAAFMYDTPWADEIELRHNDLVTPGKCLVDTPSNPVCAETIDEVHALSGNGIIVASDNVSVPPSYLAPAPKQPTVAGYHLDGSCALADLGEPSPPVPTDYDGDPRGDGVASSPEIGPDECQ